MRHKNCMTWNMETLINMENEKSHCMTWNMVRNTEKLGKWEMHTGGPGIWRRTLKKLGK